MADYRYNLKKTEDQITAAAHRSGRNPRDISLLAVGKFFSPGALKQVYDSGVRLFGESRAQELRDKVPLLPADIKWHFIGPLQTNKLKYVIPVAELIHAVDTEKLAEALSSFGLKHDKTPQILIEINTSGEQAKKGFSVEETVDKVLKIHALQNVKIRGLMTMAPFVDDITLIRKSFSTLKRKFDEISTQLKDPEFNILSMGMSGDFETAVEEGSTLVRIGTGIFGPRRR
jgi:hypothetical protein